MLQRRQNIYDPNLHNLKVTAYTIMPQNITNTDRCRVSISCFKPVTYEIALQNQNNEWLRLRFLVFFLLLSICILKCVLRYSIYYLNFGYRSTKNVRKANSFLYTTIWSDRVDIIRSIDFGFFIHFLKMTLLVFKVHRQWLIGKICNWIKKKLPLRSTSVFLGRYSSLWRNYFCYYIPSKAKHLFLFNVCLFFFFMFLFAYS